MMVVVVVVDVLNDISTIITQCDTVTHVFGC